MARAARTVEQPSAARHAALSGRSAGGEGVSIAVLGPAERVSLRAPAASLAALSKALGVALPDRPKSSALAKGGLLPAARARAGSRAALWLGPDEWLLLDEFRQQPRRRLRQGQGALFDRRHLASQRRHLGRRAGGRGDAQRGLPAGPLGRCVPRRRLLADDPGQGRDRALADRDGYVPG